MDKRIYLAAPFSDAHEGVRFQRYALVTGKAAELINGGDLVFSPVTHNFYMADRYSLPSDFSFWRTWCLSFLGQWATDLYVLPLVGWRNSKGVAFEMEYAEKHGIPITMTEI